MTNHVDCCLISGASTYLTSIPGGPSVSSICIRGGWSMGNVRDRYFKYMEAGDQFVGRCLALLPLSDVAFASSPPFFDVKVPSDDNSWLLEAVSLQFTALSTVETFGLMLQMCLSSLVFHKDWLLQRLIANHVVTNVSYVFREATAIQKFSEISPKLTVAYPWQVCVILSFIVLSHSYSPNIQFKEKVFTGIPPHVILLQRVEEIRDNHTKMIQTLQGTVRNAFQDLGLDQERMNENMLRNILDDFKKTMDDQLQRITELNRTTVQGEDKEDIIIFEDEENARIVAGKRYYLHTYGGKLHKLPKSWRFPRCGVKYIWMMWFMGNDDRQIPPLRLLSPMDVGHLDQLELSTDEKHGQVGPFKNNRRRSSKTLADLRFMCSVMIRMVKDANAHEDIICYKSVNRMFESIEHILLQKARDLQKSWLTLVRRFRMEKAKV